MFSAGKLREWRGRFFRPVGWPCRPRCTLAELYLQLQRGESVSLHFFRKAKPLPMDNLRKSGVERELEPGDRRSRRLPLFRSDCYRAWRDVQAHVDRKTPSMAKPESWNLSGA